MASPSADSLHAIARLCHRRISLRDAVTARGRAMSAGSSSNSRSGADVRSATATPCSCHQPLQTGWILLHTPHLGEQRLVQGIGG